MPAVYNQISLSMLFKKKNPILLLTHVNSSMRTWLTVYAYKVALPCIYEQCTSIFFLMQ